MTYNYSALLGKTDEIRKESSFAGRIQKFSKGRTSGKAALPVRTEKCKAFQV